MKDNRKMRILIGKGRILLKDNSFIIHVIIFT